MEFFARVAEARSFSAAARRLGVSKSVVSKHITQLEQHLGVRLLNRTTRSLSLTEIGEQFYRKCAEVVAAAEDAEREAMHMQAEPRGVLKLTAPVSFGMGHVAPAIAEFLKSHPAMNVDLTLTNRVVNLIEEGFDLSLLIEQPPSAGIVARPIAMLSRHLCASPAYIDERGTPESVAALAEHECIVFTGIPGAHKWRLSGPEGEVVATASGRLSMNNFVAIRAAALAGAGIALLPDHVAAADLESGALVRVLPGYTPPPTALTAVYPANKHVASKVRVFIDFMVQRFGDGCHAWAMSTSPGNRTNQSD